ncbi:hypothetical protein NEOLEDRAFT_1176729 [Neolentinus lepideus HHB14362 ss-1]|uniref:Uncharacterized protein n=1 Tax=Neolentinus lepideus HHB14362 ss-1 TaxID=1314782 RepID=A0A165TWW0_9AGAM|nr:hypothetical protein NEOLEDRAFT_1176729 [Neolentinus lepideus HHB14362 ss-1]
MILLPEDDLTVSPIKSQFNGDLESGPDELLSPPPPYAQAGYHAADPYYPPERDSDTSAEKRFFQALATAILIWTVFGLLLKAVFWKEYVKVITDIGFAAPEEGDGEVIRCIYSPAFNHTHLRARASNSRLSEPLFFSYGTNSTSDYKLKRKWRWRSEPLEPHVHNATASFSLGPTTKLFFFSRGTISQGTVDFTVGNSSDIEVEVNVVYASKDHFDRASVCLLKRAEDQVGIGIYTPELTAKERRSSPTTPYYYPVFNIQVQFPPPIYSHLPIPISDHPIFSLPS